MSLSSLPSHKNINLPWVAMTTLALWLLFGHTPSFWTERRLWTRDTILAIHIVLAGTIFLACAHNCLLTPSVKVCGTSCQWAHTWVGRVGMVAGVVGFSIGACLAWSRLGTAGLDLGFVIPVTIGGIGQMYAQYYGYKAICKFKALRAVIESKIQESSGSMHSREAVDDDEQQAQEIYNLKVEQRDALRSHIENMISLFVFACGIPAGVRLAELISGRKDGVVTTVAIFGVIASLACIGYRYAAIMMPDRMPERERPLNSLNPMTAAGANGSSHCST